MALQLDDSLRGFLQRVFGCPPEVADSIGARASARAWPPKAVILKQGERGGETYLVIAGRAQAVLYGLEGQLVLLNDYGPGELFGAIAQADPEPHEADVTAVEAVRAAMFMAIDFLALIEAYSCVGLAVSRLLLKRLRAANERMVERTTLSAAGRVHAELLRRARHSRDGCTVKPMPVLAVLAVEVQSTRETVSRTINALERRGLIRREADALVITAVHRLEEMVF